MINAPQSLTAYSAAKTNWLGLLMPVKLGITLNRQKPILVDKNCSTSMYSKQGICP
jgi:hypothetical protein